jgi:hypothetical protein
MDIEITFSNNKDALLLNDAPKGVSVMVPPLEFQKDYGAEDIAVSVIISVATGVPASLVAAWLYDKLKYHRSRQISIDRREIHISKGELTKIIEETIKIKE